MTCEDYSSGTGFPGKQWEQLNALIISKYGSAGRNKLTTQQHLSHCSFTSRILPDPYVQTSVCWAAAAPSWAASLLPEPRALGQARTAVLTWQREPYSRTDSGS